MQKENNETDSSDEEEEAGTYVPPEMICEIFKFSKHNDICNGMLVCKDFYKSLQIDYLWKKMSFYRWTFCRLREGFKNWKDYYVRTHTIGKRWERGKPNQDYKVQTIRRGKNSVKFSSYISDMFCQHKHLLIKSKNNEIMIWKENDKTYKYECIGTFQYDKDISQAQVCQNSKKKLPKTEPYYMALSYYRGEDNEKDPDFLEDDYHLKYIVEVRKGADDVFQTFKFNRRVLKISMWGDFLIIGFTDKVEIYNFKIKKLLHTLFTNWNAVNQLKLDVFQSKSEKRKTNGLYYLFCLSPNTGTLKVWSFDALGKKKKELNNNTNVRIYEYNKYLDIFYVALGTHFNNANPWFWGGNMRGVDVFKIGSLNKKYSITQNFANATSFCSKGRKLAVGFQDGTVIMFACNDKKAKKLWTNKFHKQCINSIQMDKVKLCAASADNCISVHDTNTGKKLYVLLGGSKMIRNNERHTLHPTKQWIYEMKMNNASVVACVKGLCRVYSFE